MTTLRTTRRTSGYALIAAIGVVAVLGLLVVGAANNAQVTHAFARSRTNDKMLADLTAEMARRLAARPALTAGAAPGATVLEVATADGITAKATVADGDPRRLVGLLIRRTDADVLVRIETARPGGRGLRHESLYLVTPGGTRPPILLTEERR